MHQQLSLLIEHYGYLGIIIALITGIIGLPLPDEVLLTFVGYQVFKGQMAYIPSLISAYAGAVGGISFSYFLGIKLGLPFLNRYGPKFHLTETKLANTRRLFIKLGPSLLLIGYFVPGVRHITAYLAGINGYSYKKFALFAYSGALIWIFTFITLGRSLGTQWVKVDVFISKYSIYLILIAVVGIIAGYIIWRNNRIIKEG